MGTDKKKKGGQRWIAIGGLGITVFDEQVLALDPAPLFDPHRILRRCLYSIRSRWSAHSFFFQAEDGIRDPLVTGVQTCALPISIGSLNESHWSCPQALCIPNG